MGSHSGLLAGLNTTRRGTGLGGIFVGRAAIGPGLGFPLGCPIAANAVPNLDITLVVLNGAPDRWDEDAAVKGSSHAIHNLLVKESVGLWLTIESPPFSSADFLF